jgi:hypothetical protein
MLAFVIGHREEKYDPEIVLLAFALEMDLRQPGNIVHPGHPIFPLENIDRVFYESEKERKMRRNVVSALKDACARMGSRYDIYHLRIEEVGGGRNITSEKPLKEVFGHLDAGIRHNSILPFQAHSRTLDGRICRFRRLPPMGRPNRSSEWWPTTFVPGIFVLR